MKQKEIDKIMKEYKDVFDSLENYDQTRELPFKRKRIDITLPVRTIEKLKKLSLRTGTSISRLIEQKFID